MESTTTVKLSRRVIGLIGRAARRLTLNLLIEIACVLTAVASGVAVAVALWAYLAGAGPLPWGWIVLSLAAAMLVVLAVIAPRLAVSRRSAAIVLDERLGLNDTLSTALAFEGESDGPVCNAQREAAAALAEMPRIRRGIPAAVPITVPQRWWWPLPLAIATVVVVWLPPIGEAAPQVDSRDMAQAKLETDAMLEEVRDIVESAPELAQELGEDFELEIPDDLKTPDQIRQEAIKKLTMLNRRLDEFNTSPEQAKFERVRERLRSLPTDGEDAATSMRRALAAGDFEVAQSELELLQSESESDAEARAAALEALAQDLQDAAADQSSSKAAMRAAGIKPADLNDLPQAAKKIKAAKNLTEAQKRELERLLNTESAASKAMESLANECKSAASQCKNPGKSSGKEPSQCKSLAKCQSKSKKASECKSACKSACKSGGSSAKAGPSTRAKGLGSGRSKEGDSEKTTLVAAKADSSIDSSAPLVGTSPISGPLRRGNPGQVVAAPILEARRRASEGVDVRRIPQRYREAVAAWFASHPVEAEDAAEAEESSSEKPE
ncbi:MAG: hypothetical protein GY894_09980 [Planctomycetes bacterium]|jgi:hypothetical protein|nr:hypothetical protein [Planctomycetota bacterium]